VNVGPADRGSAESLAAAVAEVLALDPPPEAVVVSGDLADGAFAREYERVLELLAPLPMPVHVLAGNHDDRDALREHFPGVAAGCAGEPFQYAADVGGLRLVACDTSVPGLVTGRLDLAWLEAQLAADPAPAVIAMHHPPIDVGIPALDEIGLPEADCRALADLLARSPHVRRVVAGHMHRTAFGMLGGCGVAVCPSAHLQARLEIGAADYEVVREPAAIAVHVAVGDAVVTHVQPVTAR
jgi:3',5'-cyclic AMP phosphodiesterase CpdA